MRNTRFVQGKVFTFVCLVWLLISVAIPLAAQTHPWPMFCRTAQRDGLSPYAGPTSGVVKWAFKTGYYVDSSPVVGSDGAIYFGSSDNRIYAVNPNGTLRWSYLTGNFVQSSAALGADGTVYIGSNDRRIYAIAPDGTLRWSFLTGGKVNTSPVIAADGTVICGSGDGYLRAFTQAGALRWRVYLGSYIEGSPAIDANGIIYIGTNDGVFYAINADGTIRWSYQAPDNMDSTPAVGSDGTIYIGSDDGRLYAFNPNGSIRWFFTAGNLIAASPTPGPDGTVYVGSQDKKVYAINADGTLRWSFLTGGIVLSSVVRSPDGTLYVGSTDRKVYALTPAGQKLWVYTTRGQVFSTPAIGADGTLYIGSWDGMLYAFNPGISPQIRQPDLWIRAGTGADFGNGIYNSDGAGQTAGQNVALGSTAVYTLTVENDGTQAQRITVSAPPAPTGWTVKYYSLAGVDLTTLMMAGTLTTPIFEPGAGTQLIIRVTPNSNLTSPYEFTLRITGKLAGDPTAPQDTVCAVSTVNSAPPSRQPDLWIRAGTGTDLGNGIYNGDGTNQTANQSITLGSTAVYTLTVQNDGTQAQRFTVSAPAAPSGWTVQYVNPANGMDLTGLMTAGTLITPLLNPGATCLLTVRVTPNSGITPPSQFSLRITAKLASDPTMLDAVNAVTSVTM